MTPVTKCKLKLDEADAVPRVAEVFGCDTRHRRIWAKLLAISEIEETRWQSTDQKRVKRNIGGNSQKNS